MKDWFRVPIWKISWLGPLALTGTPKLVESIHEKMRKRQPVMISLLAGRFT
jgi:hypothetical protein